MDRDFFLIHRMKKGNETAIEEFVNNYYPVLLKYCLYHIEKEEAEDAVQETFLRFFKTLPDYRHSGKALNYLYRIAGNICKDYYRYKSPEVLCEDGNLEKEESEKNQIEEINEKIDMEQALLMLAPELREVIILYYFQGLKLKEAAEIMDIGLPLVKYRIKTAKKRLRELLGKEWENG